MGDRLATTDVPKCGGAMPFPWAAGSPSNTMSPATRPTSAPSGIVIQPFGHNRHGPWFIRCIRKLRKCGGCCALFRGGVGSPSNTMWPGLRPTSVLSGILIHPTVWPQYTNVTHRQTGQWSRSIGQTVSCNGRRKITVYYNNMNTHITF